MNGREGIGESVESHVLRIILHKVRILASHCSFESFGHQCGLQEPVTWHCSEQELTKN